MGVAVLCKEQKLDHNIHNPPYGLELYRCSGLESESWPYHMGAELMLQAWQVLEAS